MPLMFGTGGVTRSSEPLPNITCASFPRGVVTFVTTGAPRRPLLARRSKGDQKRLISYLHW